MKNRGAQQARPAFFDSRAAGHDLMLGFAPFILFTLLSRLSADLALWAAFAAAFVVTIRDFVERPGLRLLDGVSLVLFGLLALGRGFCRSRNCRWRRCAPSSIW